MKSETRDCRKIVNIHHQQQYGQFNNIMNVGKCDDNNKKNQKKLKIVQIHSHTLSGDGDDDDGGDCENGENELN